jgi:Protein of unknown function (DUF2934)
MTVQIDKQPLEAMIEKQIALRAYCRWEERGRPFGTPEVDWYRAADDVKNELKAQGLAVTDY